jgi:signal transduction histidine kinase
MKFLTKINRNYLILFSAMLLVISFSTYFVLQTIIRENMKENLIIKGAFIKKQIAETNHIPELKPFIEIIRLDVKMIMNKQFKEVILFNAREDEEEVYVEYSDVLQVNNAYYLIKIREASVESEDLAISIAVVVFSLLFIAFAVSYFITKRLNKSIWHKFEYNLREIENFNFRENKSIQLRSSNIDEFDRLNLVVNNLTDKLKKDFLSLKEFTENASHEIQSPLTIASLNLEETLQQELSEEAFKKVVTAINAIQRLTILNQNLLLLTKIENNQFAANDFIVLNELIEAKIQEFDPLTREKNIKIEFIFQSGFRVKMNQHLAGILINNLLSNAVNHNVNNGFIRITADQNKITICNTGTTNELTGETIFNRFVKGNPKSYGLGLAIVKQICDTHQLDIHYSKNEFHCFTISQKTGT